MNILYKKFVENIKIYWLKNNRPPSMAGASSEVFTAHNRIVYASPPVGGLGCVLARSLRYAPFPRQNSATFL
jgi:hypothetical protein